MGQVTIFEKENCVYCKRVHDLLHKFRECVLKELSTQTQEAGASTPAIEIVTIDCGKEVAYASFCIRATGTFTVPHVFFNEEYIGSAEKFLALDKTCCGGYNVLRSKLLHLAQSPSPSPKFPPSPDAQLVKVTETLAFSSQPTNGQLQALGSFGIKSVLNVLRPDSPAYCKDEQELVCGKGSVPTGVAYGAVPLFVVTAPNVLRALEMLAKLPTPALVHDDVGSRGALIVLLSAATQIGASTQNVLEWGQDLGVNMKQFHSVISQVLLSYPALSNSKQQQESQPI